MALPWETDPAYDSIIVVANRRVFHFPDTYVAPIDAERALRWDIKEASGSDGSRQTYQGVKTARPNVTWWVYTEEHWRTWNLLIAEILPKEGRQPPIVLEVVHPDLEQLRLRKFNLERPVAKWNSKGFYEITLQLIQWFPQPKAAPKPTPASDSSLITSIPVADKLRPQTPPPPQPPSKSADVRP